MATKANKDKSEDLWYLKSGPSVTKTFAAAATVDDHLGVSDVMTTTCWSGEGITVEIEGREPKQPRKLSIEISWNEWDAIKRCVKAMEKAEKTERTNDRAKNMGCRKPQ